FHLQVTALKTEVQQLRGVAGEHARLLALLSLSDVQIVTLAGTEHAPKAGARLLWDTKHEEGTVISHDLPLLPPGKVYQLWFLTSGAPIPSGTFQPDSHRWGIIQANLPPGRADIAGAPVSLEPVGGVLQPTGNIVLAGKFLPSHCRRILVPLRRAANEGFPLLPVRVGSDPSRDAPPKWGGPPLGHHPTALRVQDE